MDILDRFCKREGCYGVVDTNINREMNRILADIQAKKKHFVALMTEGHGDDESEPETAEEKQLRLYIEALNKA